MPEILIRSLSIHARYACRDSGVCCTAGWPIPIDAALQHRLDTARRGGTLRLPVMQEHAGACVFYDGRCAIHAQLGVSFKPPSCRHFPRVALLDARGVSITLSHYCPAAASLLFDPDVPLHIVERPPGFPPGDEYEGLDARSVLPPLLRPGMLWDYEGYDAWEEGAVACLGQPNLAPEDALDRLMAVAAGIESWDPSEGALAIHVRRAFTRLPAPDEGSIRRSGWGEASFVVNRYLAARLFASWVPYRSQRLQDLVADLARAHEVLVEEAARAPLIEAVRATDLRIVHARC